MPAGHYTIRRVGSTSGTDGPAGVNSRIIGWWQGDDPALGLSDNDNVSTWEDRSGNGQNLTNSVDADRPSFQTGIQNGLPAVFFDGTEFIFRLNALTFDNIPATTLLLVVKTTTEQKSQPFSMPESGALNGYGIELRDSTDAPPRDNQHINATIRDSSSQKLFQSDEITYADGDPRIIFLFFDPEKIQQSGEETLFVVNGTDPFSQAASSNGTFVETGLNEIIFGKFQSGSGILRYTGYILECAVWQRVLSNAEEAAVNSAMITKWNIPT